MKHLIHLFSILVPILPSGAAFVETFDFNGLNLGIPDGNPSGVTNVQNVASSITRIDSVVVSMDLTGSFNGDLYAYLQHGSGLAILLNRPGRTASDLFGFGDDGFNVTFDDLAPNDVHTYQIQITPGAGNPLTGTWQPDGRAVDPDLVVDTDAQTAMLSSFNSHDGSGDWTVFLADMSGGDEHQLVNWSLEISGVPEPGTAILLLLGAGLLARRCRR